MLRTEVIVIAHDEDGHECKISKTNNNEVYEVITGESVLNCTWEELQKLIPNFRHGNKSNLDMFLKPY